MLLERLDDPATRTRYAEQVIAHGWSRTILVINLQRQLHKRAGRAVPNFKATLPPPDSDLAAQVFQGSLPVRLPRHADPRRDRDVEDSLVAHIERFLLELGAGFAFVGRQVALEVGDHDFRIDVLLDHLKLRSFVVELKSVPFERAFVGQLNFYVVPDHDLDGSPFFDRNLRPHEEIEPTLPRNDCLVLAQILGCIREHSRALDDRDLVRGPCVVEDRGRPPEATRV